MSQFLPEAPLPAAYSGADFTPPATDASGDVALMQRVLTAAVQNPSLIPQDFMAYLLDFIQTSRLSIPIGQVFGYQRVAVQVVTDFATIPSPVDGQIALLKAGSSPFDYMVMIFDQSLAQWVSPTDPVSVGGIFSNVVGFQLASTSTQLPWRQWDSAGIKPQFRVAGTLFNSSGAAVNTRVRVYVDSGNIGSTASGSDNIPSSEIATVSGSPVYLRSAWVDPTVSLADLLTVGASIQTDLTSGAGGGSASARVGVEIRWVSK